MTSTIASVTTGPALDDGPLSVQNRARLAEEAAYGQRDSVVSRSSSIFTFNASWRPDSLSTPSFLDARTRQLTNSSGSGGSRSNTTSEERRSDTNTSNHGPMDVHYEEVEEEEDRLSDASTYAERQEDPFADLNADYLASYGYPHGLGFEDPPDDFDDEDEALQYAYVYPQSKSHRSPFYSPSPTAFEHEFPSNLIKHSQDSAGWDRAFTQKGVLDAMLGVMGLDDRLRDDPIGAWEDMCWDVAAPMTPVVPSDWDGACSAVDETAHRGFAANANTDGYHDWHQARAQMSARDPDFALERPSLTAADGGVTSPTPTTPSTTTWRGFHPDVNTQDLNAERNESNVLGVSPTAIAAVSVTQEYRSPTNTSAIDTPTDDWIADAGPRAQGLVRESSSPPFRPMSFLPQESRPVSASSQLGEHASYAQAMVRQRQPVPTTTPPLQLSMIARESVPMYGARVQDRLLVGEREPLHDPPPYDAGAAPNNNGSENTPASAATETAPVPLPTPLPTSTPASPDVATIPPMQQQESVPSSGSNPSNSNHSSLCSNRAVVGARSKASVPMPMPFSSAFSMAGSSPLHSGSRTISPSPASRSTSPNAQHSSPSPTDSDALRTPTGPWPSVNALSNEGGTYSMPNGPLPTSTMSPNYDIHPSAPGGCKMNTPIIPTRSETTATTRRSRPLPTAPGGPLAPGITRVVPASWVSTSVPAPLSSPPRTSESSNSSGTAFGQGLPVKVSLEVADHDVPCRSSGSGSDGSGSGGFLNERRYQLGPGMKREYGLSKESLCLASPISTSSLRTPTKLVPLRRPEQTQEVEEKQREKALRRMRSESVKEKMVGGGIGVGNGVKRFANRCGTISRKIVNGNKVQ